MLCNYCGLLADFVSGKEMYPHRPDLYSLKFYHCPLCDASVGTHKKTLEPFGTLSNRELKKFRQKAHEVFDGYWKTSKSATRDKCYRRLAKEMNLHPNETHIGMFDKEKCLKVVEIVRKWNRIRLHQLNAQNSTSLIN